jgi:hypothetical protein
MARKRQEARLTGDEASELLDSIAALKRRK